MIRVGVIGSSEWTQRMYLGGLTEHSGGAVVALAARDSDRTRDIAAQFDIPNYNTDWRDLIARDIDAVIVSTPNDTHYEMGMAALERNLHLLCEKPLALNYADADALATAAEKRGVVHMTAFTHTFFPHYRYIAQLVDEGYIGRPYHFSLRYFSAYGWDGSPLWRFDRSRAGEGALFDIGSHGLALANQIFGPVTG
ncbi:MAG: Gfo/Idh/MocA family oxidoreductase, partial [Chloroflexota bacterium]